MAPEFTRIVYHGRNRVMPGALSFGEWVCTDPNTRCSFRRTDRNLDTTERYLYKGTAEIEYRDCGDWRDGSPIEIIVSGNSQDVQSIGEVFEQHLLVDERYFPRSVNPRIAE